MRPGGSSAVFAAPDLQANGRFRISSLASISWIAPSIQIIWIELQHEGIRMMKIRASGWMSERPVGKNVALFFNHGRQSQPQPGVLLNWGQTFSSNQGIHFEAISTTAHLDLWI